jgi:hypothetical protein
MKASYAGPRSESTHFVAHAANVVADAAARHVDLTGDNELPGLLSDQEDLRFFLARIEAELTQTRKRIAEKLGNAASATLPGWKLTRVTRARKGYTVEPSVYSYVDVKRV